MKRSGWWYLEIDTQQGENGAGCPSTLGCPWASALAKLVLTEPALLKTVQTNVASSWRGGYCEQIRNSRQKMVSPSEIFSSGKFSRSEYDGGRMMVASSVRDVLSSTDRTQSGR